jgi:2-(3-amino-3-carboxypropyl)histidine synthase
MDAIVHCHSCLVPVDAMAPGVRVLYVFVGIAFDAAHLCATVRANFPPGARLALAGTIQFAGALAAARAELAPDFPRLGVPQAKPLSPGEVLGCTAPALAPGEVDAIVFVADGRFHLEAIMIRNSGVPAFRYDPYGKVMTAEAYDVAGMAGARRRAVAAAAEAAAAPAQGRRPWGLVLGTLGRQGSPAVLDRLAAALDAAGVAHFTVLLGEVSAQKLAAFGGGGVVGAWVQVACPRLSIDWGEGLADAVGAPVLTPFEAHAALGL